MDAYVVIAEVTVPLERQAEFIAFSPEDARDSVAKEPGCQQFDVLSSADGSPTVVFYEVYDDRAASRRICRCRTSFAGVTRHRD